MSDGTQGGGRQRWPWRWILLGAGLLALLLVLGGWGWFTGQRDLDAVTARAVAMGVDLHPPPTDAAVQAAWQALAARMPAGFNGLLPSPREVWRLEPARVAMARPDAQPWLRDLDGLPAGRLAVTDQEMPGLTSLLAVELWLADDDRVPGLVRRWRGFLERGGPPGDCLPQVRTGALRQLARVLAHRLWEGRLPADPVLVQDLLALADLAEGDLRLGPQRMITGLLAAARRGPPALAEGLWGSPSHHPMWQAAVLRFYERAGRQAFFTRCLDHIDAIRRTPDLHALARLAATTTWTTTGDLRDMLPARRLGMYADGVVMSLSYQIEVPLNLRLLAAELEHAPWPDDPFAATPTPLHRAERDGVLVGAWSVGGDGTDNGGEWLRDVCLPLHGQPGKPRLGDAPEPPAPPVMAAP